MKGTTKNISQKGGFLNFLGSLMRTGLPLMKYSLTSLAKSVLIPLGLTAAASTTDVAIQKKMFGFGMTALIISREDMDLIMKIVKSFEESGLLVKDATKTIKTEAKEKKWISSYISW